MSGKPPGDPRPFPGFSTRAIHVGQYPDEVTGSVTVPIYATSTYRQGRFGSQPLYEYSRVQNPTRDALEECLASLENAEYATVFSSGMAAIHALFQTLSPGDGLLLGLNVYGGTYRLAEHVFRDWGLIITYVYPVTQDSIAKHIRSGITRLVLIETPSNPLLDITDISATSTVVHKAGALLAVDNTFATPYLQNPLDLGADIVIHSTTKFLNGHSDGLGGVLVYRDAKLHERLKFIQKSTGAILSPFEAWLVLRGIKTLSIRMDRHNENARTVAEFLRNHPRVKDVYYPGFEDHPGYDVHRRQARGAGGIVSFDVHPDVNLRKFVRSLRLCYYGESLGGVETLICHPATMTHASLPKRTRARLGVTPTLFRISVGIENPEDIIADLEQALAP